MVLLAFQRSRTRSSSHPNHPEHGLEESCAVNRVLGWDLPPYQARREGAERTAPPLNTKFQHIPVVIQQRTKPYSTYQTILNLISLLVVRSLFVIDTDQIITIIARGDGVCVVRV